MKKSPTINRFYKGLDFEMRMKRIQLTKVSGLIRQTDNVCELIIGDRYECFVQGGGMSNGGHLIGLVKKDAAEFLKTKKKLPEVKPNVVARKVNFEYDLNDGELIGVDLNHAYWRIAFIYGIISDKTYISGLKSDDFKVSRLTALSILGRRKTYNKLYRGQVIDEYVEIPENQKLRETYNFIRKFCFETMNNLADFLNYDFESYNTDAIYFRNTEDNLRLVCGYLDSRQLLYKLLTNKDEPR